MILTSDERRGIEEFYLEMRERMLSYALAALCDSHLAEEAIQETFRIVCMKPEELLASQNPRGWIIQTLKFTIQNMKRSRDKANAMLTQYLAANESDAFSENRVSLDVAYANVASSEEFLLVKELAVDGRSHQEMAQSRGISVAACKKRVQRAKEFLRRKI